MKEIKSMMVQISNEVKFHQHDEVDREMNRLGHSNKQLKSEVRMLKEDNQLILARLQSISNQTFIKKRTLPRRRRRRQK